MSRSTTVAFYGISHPHSSARYRSAQNHQGAEVVGAYDDNPVVLEAFCAEVGARPLAKGDICRDPDIDAIFVHSKSDHMAPMACEGIAAGKHVLVEKPGGADLNDLRSLALAARNTKSVVRVGYNFHFSPALKQAKASLEGAEIGRISLVRGHGGCSMNEHLSEHLNQARDMSGGLWVIGVHVLHLMIDLLGPPIAVRASIEKLSTWSKENSREDMASLTLFYPDKMATFDFTVHENCEWFESSEITAYGDAGQLTHGILPGRVEALKLTPRHGTSGWTSWKEGNFVTPWSGHKSLYSELPQIGNRFFFDEEVKEFIEAAQGVVTTGGATALTAYQVAAVVAASLESSKMGGTSVVVQEL